MSIILSVSDLYSSLQSGSPIPTDIPPILEEYDVSGYSSFFKKTTPVLVQDNHDEAYVALDTTSLSDGTPVLVFQTYSNPSFVAHSVGMVHNAALNEFQPVIGPIVANRSPFSRRIISNILLRGLVGTVTKNVELPTKEYRGERSLIDSLELLFERFVKEHIKITSEHTDLFGASNSCKVKVTDLSKYTYLSTQLATEENSFDATLLFYFNPTTAAFGIPLDGVRAFGLFMAPVVYIQQAKEAGNIQLTFSGSFRVELYFPGGLRFRVIMDSSCSTELATLI